VEAGQTVAASAKTVLFLVAADLTVVRVNANVSEKDIGKIKPGDKVSFAVEALPNRTFIGQVTQIDGTPRTGQNAASNNVVISATNPDFSLEPGMSATIRIMIDKGDDASKKEEP
jgi:multidrug resistance efflux pump